MIGPFKPAPSNFKCVFVLIDKFSKWIEYMPLTKASLEKAVEFLDQIIHRFGFSNSIITDLGLSSLAVHSRTSAIKGA
jgi:hypothetical protein